MSLSLGPANSGGGNASWPVCVALGASQEAFGDGSVSEEALEAEGAETVFTEHLADLLVKKGREAQEASVVTLLTAGSGPSRGPFHVDQWLLHFSEGREVSAVLQNLLGAEYAETTDRSEEESRRPVSTSVSWAPSKSSMERRWLCLQFDTLCSGGSVFENHCGSAEEAGEGPPVGKQNKDLLLWKDQGALGVLLVCLANSCWCPLGRPVWPGPRKRSLCKDGWLPLDVWLGTVALGEGVE